MATSHAARTATPDNGTTPPQRQDDLKSLPLAEVEERLGTSADGLTQAEATKRLAQYGPNEIAEKQTSLLLTFLKYFWGRSRG